MSLDRLDEAARRRGCTIGVRAIYTRAGDVSSAVLATLEVRAKDGRPRFRDRELVAAERLIGGGGFERSLEDAAARAESRLRIALGDP